jgi:phasin family protein
MSSFQAAASFPFASANPGRARAYFSWASLSLKTLLEAHHKNLAAFAHANQVAYDGLTAVVQGQANLFNTTAEECSRNFNDVLAAASLDEKARRQADTARHAYESSLTRFGELYEIAAKAQVAATDILTARLAEALEELRSVFVGPVEPAPETAAAPVDAVVESLAPVAVRAAPLEAEPVEPAPAEHAPDDPALAEAAPEPAAEANTVEISMDPEPVATSAEPPAASEDPTDDDEADAPVAPKRTTRPRGPRTPGSGAKSARRPPSRG